MISISRDSIQKPMCMFKKENCERKVWTGFAKYVFFTDSV